MDHKTSYAFHIAQAIRHKKAMAQEPAEAELPQLDGEEFDPEEDDGSVPIDPKEARKDRLKAILSR